MAGQTAAPAVKPESEAIAGLRGGFTLIEVLTVVIIIGILSALAYASLADIIFSNRAKESAQTMRTFVERVLTDAKRQNEDVTITLNGNSITATISPTANVTDTIARESLSSGYASSTNAPNINGITNSFNNGVLSEFRIGLSGITGEGYFVACGGASYCAAAVKTADKNSFTAYIKRGNNATWEAL